MLATRKPWGLRSFALLGVLFLYAPIVVMVLFSFNDSEVSVWPIRGLTLHWWGDMVDSEAVRSSFALSLQVAAIATAIAGVLGTMLAYAAHRFGFPGKGLLQRVVLMPLVVPGVVTGIALLTIFTQIDVQLSMVTIVAAHATFLVAVFFTTVFARLQGLGIGIERAAMDLGASEIRAFFVAVLPNLRTTLLGAAVIAFTLSFDEIAITFFVTGTQNTVPMLIYSSLRTGLTPTINALATASLLLSLVPIAIGAILGARLTRRRQTS
jgi:spermidine/putrescine transport system permease protein